MFLTLEQIKINGLLKKYLMTYELVEFLISKTRNKLMQRLTKNYRYG